MTSTLKVKQSLEDVWLFMLFEISLLEDGCLLDISTSILIQHSIHKHLYVIYTEFGSLHTHVSI